MRFFKKAAVVVTAIGLVAALAHAQGSLTLRLKPAVGSKFQYKVTMNTSGGATGQQSTMNMTFNQHYTIKSKNAQGLVIESKTTNAKVTGSGAGGNGKAVADQMNKQTITATYSALGAYVSGNVGSGQAGAMLAQAGAQGVTFPQAAVRVGSTWSSTIDVAKLLAEQAGPSAKVVSGGKVPVNFKVTGIKVINGKTVAGIAATMNGTVVLSVGGGASGGQAMQMKMNLKSTSSGQVDVGTGMVRTMTTDGTVGINMGQMVINQKIKTTMTLL